MLAVETWNGHAAAQLHARAEAIAAAPPPAFLGEARISFADLANAGADLADRLAGGVVADRGLYIIRLDEDADPAAVRQAFAAARASGELRLPQLNLAPGEGGDARVLYVGSSCATAKRKGTIAARLKQHLLRAPTGTYALNLSRWAGGLAGGIRVLVYNYSDDTERAAVVAVEDWLSETLAPICGRRGTQR